LKDPTDFGYEQVPEADKARRVGAVFDRVAERYDLMNDLMSLGLHRLWKAFAISIARPRPGDRVLDVASGSADLASSLGRRVMPGGQVWLADINRRMLERGRDRVLDDGLLAPAVQCDASACRFRRDISTCVTVAFGLRNMTPQGSRAGRR
jgi:demethylmenaquinone methyltransferase/2-methoxy-6-polyprenyl-1,4-benzoquinol methylase